MQWKQALSNVGLLALSVTLRVASTKAFWYLTSASASAYLLFAPIAQKWDRADIERSYMALAGLLPCALWLSKDIEFQLTEVQVRRRLGHQFKVDEMVYSLNRIRATYEREVQLISGARGFDEIMASLSTGALPGVTATGELPSVDTTSSPITEALARYGVNTSQIGQTRSPYFTRYTLRLESDRKGKPSKVKDVEALSRELQLAIACDDEPIISVTKDGLLVDVPLPESERKAIPAETVIVPTTRSLTDALLVSLGVGIDGQLYCLDLSDSQTPHALIGGTTGSGKTEFLRSLLLSAICWYPPDVVQLAIADPKRVSFGDFADYDGLLAPIAKESEAIALLVATLTNEMQRRYNILDKAGAKDIQEYNRNGGTMPRIVFLFDEYSEFAESASDDEFIAAETGLKRLTQKARAAGIHVLLSTQKPIAKSSHNSKGLDTVLRSNLPASICLRVRTANDSQIVLGEPGGEKLLGKGDMLAILRNTPERYQSPLITSTSTVKAAIARYGHQHPITLSNAIDTTPKDNDLDFLERCFSLPDDGDLFEGFEQGNDTAELPPEAIAIIEFCNRKNQPVTARDCLIGVKQLRGIPADEIRDIFRVLAHAGKGEILGDGTRLAFAAYP